MKTGKPNVVITPRVPKYPEESPKEGLKYLLDQRDLMP